MMPRLLAGLLALAWFLFPAPAPAAPPGMETILERVRHEWGVAVFDLAPERRADALETLAEMAHLVAGRYPGETAPRAWEGIVLASLAETRGPLIGYFTARSARELLQAVELRDPSALDGPGYAALGMLHATAPVWPFSFGDRALARAYFEKAIAMAPYGMEAHYFYGRFLLRHGEYQAAIRHLRLALGGSAPCGPGCAGTHDRRQVRRVLAQAEERRP
jgi:tetratricopeptide (TPR) repeat protein